MSAVSKVWSEIVALTPLSTILDLITVITNMLFSLKCLVDEGPVIGNAVKCILSLSTNHHFTPLLISGVASDRLFSCTLITSEDT